MTELSTEEAAVVQRFEAAADAEESLRMRLAVAIGSDDEGCDWTELTDFGKSWYLRLADVAIAVMRGES